MKSNYPLKAKPMAPVKMDALCNDGEFNVGQADTGQSRQPKKPAAQSAKSAMFDGPYGGKRPA
jgi:hypothetical protein